MKIPILNIVFLTGLLFTFTNARKGKIAAKVEDSITLDSVDLVALAHELALHEHADEDTMKFVLRRAVNGTVLHAMSFPDFEDGSLVKRSVSLVNRNTPSGITCNTKSTSPEPWKMIYTALLVARNGGICTMDPTQDCTLYKVIYTLGTKIEICSTPAKPRLSCMEVAERSINISNKCIMWFGANNYRTSGVDFFGNMNDKIPAHVLNNRS